MKNRIIKFRTWAGSHCPNCEERLWVTIPHKCKEDLMIAHGKITHSFDDIGKCSFCKKLWKQFEKYLESWDQAIEKEFQKKL